MYDRIASNVRRTWLLIAGFSALVLAVGWLFGYYTGLGWFGLAGAALLSVAMSWGSYMRADRIALAVSRAVPADPVAHRQLHNVVEALAIGSGLPKPRVYVVEDEAPNAFATGRDPEHAAVAVTTGLLEKMNRDELEAVLAHELAHIKNRDILVMTMAVTLVGVVVLLADWMLRALWWGGLAGGRDRDRGGGLGAPVALLGVALLVLAPLIAQIMQFAISRRREFLADAEAVFLTRNPAGMISALEKLRDDTTVVRTATRATAHLWIEEPNSHTPGRGPRGATRPEAWLNRLFDTHPPIEERIRALREMTFGGLPEVPPARA